MSEVRLEFEEDGALAVVTLAAPPGNVLDRVRLAQLRDLVRRVAAEPRAKALLFCAEGDHFSYGASIPEHRASEVRALLQTFHDLLRELAHSGLVLLAAVQGRCLGGGLELVAFSHRVFARPEAELGQPEIALGVFAPVASLVLPERIGRGAADELLIAGHRISAARAGELGLVDELATDPKATARAWFRARLAPHSASSLRFATRAARLEFTRRFEDHIVDLERLYLSELMKTADASEGIEAFLAKRPPQWRDA